MGRFLKKEKGKDYFPAIFKKGKRKGVETLKFMLWKKDFRKQPYSLSWCTVMVSDHFLSLSHQKFFPFLNFMGFGKDYGKEKVNFLDLPLTVSLIGRIMERIIERISRSPKRKKERKRFFRKLKKGKG